MYKLGKCIRQIEGLLECNAIPLDIAQDMRALINNIKSLMGD